ncbi:MAG TPA: GatB/YqeY domain-containing protein [Jiangellaceae bacterium]|nr:GatB/YqeY domain-containing protein [Jiangellaceae bacterium]
MPSLKTRLHDDLVASMRARDELRTSALRMALAAVTNAEVAGAESRELSDDDVVAVLSKETKRRRESAAAFRDGGRKERSEREDAEAVILEEYLPEQLDDTELDELATSAIAEVGATGPRDMGAVMRVLNPRVAGRAEGGRVAAAVRRQLG